MSPTVQSECWQYVPLLLPSRGSDMLLVICRCKAALSWLWDEVTSLGLLPMRLRAAVSELLWMPACSMQLEVLASLKIVGDRCINAMLVVQADSVPFSWGDRLQYL